MQVNEEFVAKLVAGETYRNMGNTYNNIGEHDKAIDCYRKALNIAEELNEKRSGKNIR